MEPRANSSELDAILGEKFPVLDDGFVRVIDYMGNDSSIVQAARVSYGKGTKKVSEDRGLIRYLMRHSHTTPFEMCEIKLHVRVPMDHWRQWIRHRTANVNEYSTRYSEAIDSVNKVTPNKWRKQSNTNKQGGEEFIDEKQGQEFSYLEEELYKTTKHIYQKMLDAGISREQARKILPLSTYTEAYWKIDLHNLLHFLRLRLDPHAQEEIRTYATVMGNIVKKWVPITWEAFEDYRLNSITLSKKEWEILGECFGTSDALLDLNKSLRNADLLDCKSRESKEFRSKLERMGIDVNMVYDEYRDIK